MATAFAPPARHSPATHAYRHHPYAAPPAQSSSRPKWAAAAEKEKMAARDNLPPSPPRSRRDESETPSLGLPLGMAFGANGGGKWWDEELVRFSRLSSMNHLLIISPHHQHHSAPSWNRSASLAKATGTCYSLFLEPRKPRKR